MAEAKAAASTAAATETASDSTMDALLEGPVKKAFKPKTDAAWDAIKSGVGALVLQAMENQKLVSDDAIKTIEGIIAELDKKLSDQVNQIIHHADYQALEGSWRGLHHLVNNTEIDENLKIRVMNVSKNDLAKSLKRFKGNSWDQSPLFKAVYSKEYDTPGAAPYGCLIGDYQFDHGSTDVDTLAGIAKVAAAAHAPFFAASAPKLFQMDSWQELADPRDLTKIFQSDEYAPWRALRQSDDSRYIGLTMPRVLAREPYSAKNDPDAEFAFEEEVTGEDHAKYTWFNAAYAMGVNINRAHKNYGWCARIRGVESGGLVEDLPCHTFQTADGGVDMKCPTEISITERRESELAKNGFIPISHWKNTNYAVFVGAQSLNQPATYDDPDATASAALSARMQYLFATCRFAHFLKCIVRDKIGSFKERDDMQRFLNNWIMKYVEPDPKNQTEEGKARKPLAAAEITVAEIEGNPGYYSTKIFLRPHYQLEGLNVSLSLVSKVPSAKGA